MLRQASGTVDGILFKTVLLCSQRIMIEAIGIEQ